MPPTCSRPSRLEQQLTNLAAVASVDSITSFLSRGPEPTNWPVVGEIKRELASIQFGGPDAKPVDVQELSATLYSLRGYLGAAVEVVQKETPDLVPQFNSLRDAIEALRKEMLRGDTNRVAANALKLAEFQQASSTMSATRSRPCGTRTTAPRWAWRICRRRCTIGSSASPASTCSWSIPRRTSGSARSRRSSLIRWGRSIRM